MAQQITRFEALCLAVERAGSQQKLADALGVTQAGVSLWVNRTKRLPAEHVLKAAELFGISPSDLRPDLYPRDLGQRFYGVAFVNDEPELPLTADERVIGIDRRATGADRFAGVDHRARRVSA